MVRFSRLTKLSSYYLEHTRQLSFKYNKEDDFKKRAYSIYSEEKNFTGVKEKDPFLVYDDEKIKV